MKPRVILAFVAGCTAPSLAVASDFGRVAQVALAAFGAGCCAVAALVVFAMGFARDPGKLKRFARFVGTSGLVTGMLGLVVAGRELVRQDVSFGFFVVGSVAACLWAFLRFESRLARASTPDP